MYGWEAATVLYIAGGLSDVFDGPAARRWPQSNIVVSAFRWIIDPEAWDSLGDCVYLYCAMAAITVYTIFWLHNWTTPIILAIMLAIGYPLLVYHNKFKDSPDKRLSILSIRLNGGLGAAYFIQSFYVLEVFTYLGFNQWFTVLSYVYVIVAIVIILSKWDKTKRLWATE
jgi:phosphatidylglycerophosphate synthase